jgi:hypothetical protein
MSHCDLDDWIGSMRERKTMRLLGRLTPTIVLIGLVLGGAGLAWAEEAVEMTVSASEGPRILSAFFGLDEAMGPRIVVLCPSGPGKDGMPVVFNRRIDQSTLDAADFAVITAGGETLTPDCATLRPAVEKNENRTVLLIGQLGGQPAGDPPVRVEIVGSLKTAPEAGDEGLELKGLSCPVTPLEAGPFLVYAEAIPAGETAGDPNACRTEGTVQTVKAVWAGGVRAASGRELSDRERLLFKVILLGEDGAEIEVVPAALADLNDPDNVIDLCLDQPGRPVRIVFPAGAVIDPRDDPNPETVLVLEP